MALASRSALIERTPQKKKGKKIPPFVRGNGVSASCHRGGGKERGALTCGEKGLQTDESPNHIVYPEGKRGIVNALGGKVLATERANIIEKGGAFLLRGKKREGPSGGGSFNGRLEGEGGEKEGRFLLLPKEKKNPPPNPPNKKNSRFAEKKKAKESMRF